jgi:hypothetical protein
VYPATESLSHLDELVRKIDLLVAGEAVLEQAGDDRTYPVAGAAKEHEQVTVVLIHKWRLFLSLNCAGWPSAWSS